MHHDLAHHGRIVVSGTPGALVVLHADGRPYGTPPPVASRPVGLARGAPPVAPPPVGRATVAVSSAGAAPPASANHAGGAATSRARDAPAALPAGLVEEARLALTGLGFRPAQATAAVADASLQVTAGVSLEQLVRAALVVCRRHLRT